MTLNVLAHDWTAGRVAAVTMTYRFFLQECSRLISLFIVYGTNACGLTRYTIFAPTPDFGRIPCKKAVTQRRVL